MPFRLFYKGPLNSNGNKDQKHRIRLALHPQLLRLWDGAALENHRPLLDKQSITGNILYELDAIDYACLVTDRLDVLAELDILFLRPHPPGAIYTGGDIDNRLKTLLDGLRRPLDKTELPGEKFEKPTPNPCHCLLSDDSLITRLSVTTDTLLDSDPSSDDIILIITVTVVKKKARINNLFYIT